MFKSDQLSKDRVETLDKLGFVWNASVMKSKRLREATQQIEAPPPPPRQRAKTTAASGS